MNGYCAAGTKLPKRGPCPKCGAKSDEPCPEAYRIAAEQRDALVKKLEEIHDIAQDTTLHVECWQKLQNIAATAASALASIKDNQA
jgi:hypothetical protein